MGRHTAQKYCPTRGQRLWIDMQHAATSASKLLLLHLDMIGLPRNECLLECLIFITLLTFDVPGSTPGNSVCQHQPSGIHSPFWQRLA